MAQVRLLLDIKLLCDAAPIFFLCDVVCCFFFTDFAGETGQVLDERPDDNEEEDDNDEELKAPEQEIEMDKESITEDEKQAIPEFFEGRPSKTPDRYLKIRNYILDQW